MQLVPGLIIQVQGHCRISCPLQKIAQVQLAGMNLQDRAVDLLDHAGIGVGIFEKQQFIPALVDDLLQNHGRGRVIQAFRHEQVGLFKEKPSQTGEGQDVQVLDAGLFPPLKLGDFAYCGNFCVKLDMVWNNNKGIFAGLGQIIAGSPADNLSLQGIGLSAGYNFDHCFHSFVD